MRLSRQEVVIFVLGSFMFAAALMRSPDRVEAGGQVAEPKYAKTWEYRYDPALSNRIAPNFRFAPVVGDVSDQYAGKEVVSHSSNFVDVYADQDGDGAAEIINSVYVPNARENIPCDQWGCGVSNSSLIPPVLADMNGDGKKEIVAYDSQFNRFSYINDQGIFKQISAGGDLIGFTVGDIDHDGTPPEIVGIVAAPSIFSVFVHNGSKRWASDFFNSSGELPGSPVIADVDMDGKNDIIYSLNAGLTVIKKPSGTAYHWQVPASMASTKIMSNIAVGDVNADGKNDIVFATFSHIYALTVDNGQLTQLWRTAVLRRTTQSICSTLGSGSIALGDIDGDPLALEVLYKSTCVVFIAGGANGAVVWNGTDQIIGKGGVSADSDPALADVDGDGLLDVLLGVGDGLTILHPLKSTLTVDSIDIFYDNAAVSPAGDVAVADLDGDGKLEIIWTQVFSAILPEPGEEWSVGNTNGPGVLRVYTANESGAPAFDAWPRVHGNNRATALYGDFDHASFLRGDVNGDKRVDVSDIVKLSSYLSGSENLSCLKAADVNDDGAVTKSDRDHLSGFLYAGTHPAPSAPYPKLGIDPTPDALYCN